MKPEMANLSNGSPSELAPPAPAMGVAVAGGMAWLTFTSVAGRLVSFAAQIVLGWKLSKGDFGLYAIAIAFAGLIQVFKDGGLRQLLVQRGSDYHALLGPVFWLSMVFNAATALVLVAAAPLGVHLYGRPELYPLLWVMAAAIPLATPSLVSQARLALDLRFRTASWILLVSNLLRHGLTIVFAATGFGAMSFVLPLLFVSVYESAAGIVATGEVPWKYPLQARRWSELLYMSRWLIAGTLATLLIVSGDYLVLGWLEDDALVGVYFFGFQLAVQIHAVLIGNLQIVLFPSLAKVEGDLPRMAAAFR